MPSRQTHDDLDMITRNRLADVSFFVSSCGELVVLAILAGILEGVIKADDTDSNTRALSIVCAYSAGVWSESQAAFYCRFCDGAHFPALQSFAPSLGSCGSNIDLVIGCHRILPM